MLEDFDTNVTKLATFLGFEVNPEKLEEIKIATSSDKMKQRLVIGTPGHLRHEKSKAYGKSYPRKLCTLSIQKAKNGLLSPTISTNFSFD